MKNKFAAALFSLIVAFGIWLYVITTVSPGSEDTFSNIPVTLQNEAALSERGLMVTTQDVPTVTLRLSGNRSDLIKLNSSNIVLTADLSGIYEPGERKLTYNIAFPGDIANNAFVVESQSPQYVTVDIERKITKDVDVALNFQGEIADGYLADTQNPSMDHPQISVTGPESVVNRIAQAVVDVDLQGRTESVNEALPFTLCDTAGDPVDVEQVVTDVAQINLSIKIQKTKEIPLKVTVEPGGGATEDTSDIQIEPSSIRVAGSETLLNALTEINLGTIKLSELTLSKTVQDFNIKLPEGVTNLTGVTQARVTIQFPNLKTQTFKVTNFRVTNVPSGMTAEVVTKELQVTIRGPVAAVNALKDSNVTAILDLSSAALGTSTVTADIRLPDNSPAGAVGNYTVTVNLTVASADEEGT